MYLTMDDCTAVKSSSVDCITNSSLSSSTDNTQPASSSRDEEHDLNRKPSLQETINPSVDNLVQSTDALSECNETVGKKQHPKLVKQKSVTFGKVETEANGVVTSIINLASEIQSGLDPDPIVSDNLGIVHDPPHSDTQNSETSQLSAPGSRRSSGDIQVSRNGHHLYHHHHHHHHHTAHVTVDGHPREENFQSRRISDSSYRSRSLSLSSRPSGHLRRALRETWDSKLSFFLACLSCTVGMFNINKFALLVMRFGIGFVFEFILLSLLFGIPLFCMYIKLGQYIRTGVISMWFISPAFHGVGVVMVIIIWLIGVCSAIPVTWMINFFRDSFVSGLSPYKWRGCSYEYALRECVTTKNDTVRIGLEVSSYFHGRILDQYSDDESGFGHLNFENIVFLAFIWVVVFFCLSRGLKWYSKVIYVIAFVPEISILALVVRLVHSNADVNSFFHQGFIETLSDGMSWFSAAKEVVFTWIIFGAIVMQLASHSKSVIFTNRMLIILVIVTNVVLILFSCGLASCINTLHQHSLHVTPSSFEDEDFTSFLTTNSTISIYQSYPINLLFGTYFVSSNNTASMYHVMRFSTELFPATMAIKQMEDETATFWCALFYLTMIFFGVGQQMILARTIIEAIIDSQPFKLIKWRTTITLIICLSMLLLGIPLMSSNGIHILYFIDFTVGTLWWIILIYLLVNIGIFHIKAPDENMSLLAYIAHQSIKPKLIAVGFVINWNIFTPGVLLVLFIIFLRINVNAFVFEWSQYPYQMWTDNIKALSAIIPIILLALPTLTFIYMIFHSYYQVGGETTLFKIIEDLFEPSEPLPKWPQASISRVHSRASRSSSLSSRIFNFGLADDPPPKYTPPPSYSSATAKSLIKELDELRLDMNVTSVSEHPSGLESTTTLTTTTSAL